MNYSFINYSAHNVFTSTFENAYTEVQKYFIGNANVIMVVAVINYTLLFFYEDILRFMDKKFPNDSTLFGRKWSNRRIINYVLICGHILIFFQCHLIITKITKFIGG